MKELKKKYIKPYACVHECAYGEGLMNDATVNGPQPEGNGDDQEFARPNGNSIFFETDDENEDF